MTPDERLRELVESLTPGNTGLVLVTNMESDGFEILSRYDHMATALLLMEAAQHTLRQAHEQQERSTPAPEGAQSPGFPGPDD